MATDGGRVDLRLRDIPGLEALRGILGLGLSGKGALTGLEIEGKKARLTEDAHRVLEMIEVVGEHLKGLRTSKEVEVFASDVGAVALGWLARFGELMSDPSRALSVQNPFRGERRDTRRLIEHYDLPVSFRDAIKHWD